jgi:glutathione synthase/RimK-type ligase-like ATP-grasp enzyme
MILIISYPEDRHAQVMVDDLARHGAEVVLFDLRDLPDRATLSIDYAEPSAPRVYADLAERGTAELTAATAVWWRRPQAPALDAIADQDAFGFSHGEWHEATNGLYQLIGCPWMNQPVRNEVASRKAVQLALASQLGMRVPRTLMTSDAARATAFVEAEGIGNVIYKTFAATHQVWRETRLFRQDDLDMLDSLRYAPVIFQEYIPAIADLRVTVVRAEVFAMSIDARGSDYEIDFRVDMAQATTDVAELPDSLIKQLRQMMDRLGLAYGAIDLRLTDDGDYVFLEINPAGEFLFAEHGADLPITDAVSRWLRQPY